MRWENGTGQGKCHTPAVLSRAPFFILLLLAGCASPRHASRLESGHLAAGLSLPAQDRLPMQHAATVLPSRDTIVVTDDEGRKILVMKAVRDDDTGEMVATEQLTAATVTSRFRNVAERHGRVDIAFDVTVPSAMQDSRWQLRIHPDMFVLEDSLRLEDVVITGAAYRKAQLRGYQQYERFLSRIISDRGAFIDRRNLELFLERNIPEVVAFRNDTSFVSDEQFASAYGVTARQAVDHYTRRLAMSLNEFRRSRTDAMRRRYIKAPIVTEGIRLDTVMVNAGGDFVYTYVQSVNTRPRLRKVDVTLSGEVYEQDRCVYDIPRSQPLTFYISSLSTLADDAERYLTKVVERRVEASSSWNIDFRTGRADIEPELGDNSRRIREIKSRLLALMTDDTFELDSITIAASASPEGTAASNMRLSQSRAEMVSDYFSRYVRHVSDSLIRDAGAFLSLDGSSSASYAPRRQVIGFRSSPGGENWSMLDRLVRADSLLSVSDKLGYLDIADEPDPDLRERRLSEEPYYSRLMDEMYPLLRTVQFSFHLHRRGMVKDTVHTTVLDSTYMRGVEALRERDYDMAVALLFPYEDCNAAVACLAKDRNLSALRILRGCKPSAKVDYLLALACSRQGDDEGAVQSYLASCRKDPSFIHRGNLDPEISSLIRRYDLDLLQ